MFRLARTRVPRVFGIESDGPLIYCSNDIYLHRLDTQTGEAIPVSADLHHGGPLQLLGDQLYILSNRGVIGTGENLARIELGSEPPFIADLGLSFGQGLRLLHDSERGTFYWATGITRANGHVVRYDLGATGPPHVLFEGQDVYGGSATDDDYLYWISNTAITRLKKW